MARHQRIADALMARQRPDPDAVAAHLQRASDARAVDWLIQAGDRAEAEEILRSCYNSSLLGTDFGIVRLGNGMESAIQQPEVSSAQREEADEVQPHTPVPSDTSPEEFYAKITKRADVRAVLEELASV